MQNNRYLRAIARQSNDRAPLWMMRQAGRYLPEYQASRRKAGDFISLCKNSDLACEVTVQPIDRFGFDAAIIFSDILTLPLVMNRGLRFEESKGPIIDKPVRTQADVDACAVEDIADATGFVMEAIIKTKKALADRVPLIGFCGSPWTVGTYMVEGGSSKSFSVIKRMMYHSPDLLMSLLNTLVSTSVGYLSAQIEAGADAVMIFDTWGGVLCPKSYQKFSCEPMKRIVEGVKARHPSTPITVFTKGVSAYLAPLSLIGADVLGVDWTTSLEDARRIVSDKVALQGNIDPCVLYGSDASITLAIEEAIASYGTGGGHILNLGHGLLPDISPDKVKFFVDTAHRLSLAQHAASRSQG